MRVSTLLALATATTASASRLLNYAGFGMDPFELGPFYSPAGLTVSAVYNDAANAYEGSGYLKLDFPADTKQQAPILTGLTLTRGTNYTASVWAKSGAANGNCVPSVVFVNSKSQVIASNTGPALTTDYAQVNVSVKATAKDAGSGLVYFAVGCSGGVAETVYFDEFLLERP